MNSSYWLLVFILGWTFIQGDSFVVKSKKKQPQISAQDCCDILLIALQNDARIMQYVGYIQTMELAWAQDFLNDESQSFFKLVTPKQLEKYHQLQQKRLALQKNYEEGLQEVNEGLKELKQEVLLKEKKK